ncbi:MAG TPA: hypothetical protein VF337_11990 [Candidatus Limnocylindrales bacterium]
MDDASAGTADGRSRLVEIRCGFAEMARAEAAAAAARADDAKRAHDEQAEIVAQAQAEADVAGAHSAKDEAHRAFRVAVGAARARGQVEAAATAWLDQINAINSAGRAGQAKIRLESDVADALRFEWTRLSDMAEASAAMAESAMKACLAAREALEADGGDVEMPPSPSAPPVQIATPAWTPVADIPPERAVAAAVSEPSAGPLATPEVPLPGEESQPSADSLVVDLRSPEPQVIVRLMRREGRAITALATRLAGSDPTTRSRWGLLISSFVDSVVASAMDDACVDFPGDNQFWAQFEPVQAREVIRGLAALGFRYDGFEGFADGRVPTQRDLSMAVGNAGLLPARVHYWPKTDEAEGLFRGIRVSADTFIAMRAPALTLGELLRVLGRRAEQLSDLWNEWPLVRPLLFETS